MSDKSYVSMERHRCIVCGADYDTGAILLNKRLRPTMERHTVTGLCPEHDKLFKEGYIAMVGIDPKKSRIMPNGNIDPNQAYRTGNVAHVRREVAARIFNIPLPDNMPMTFCEDEVIEKLRAMMPKEGE